MNHYTYTLKSLITGSPNCHEIYYPQNSASISYDTFLFLTVSLQAYKVTTYTEQMVPRMVQLDGVSLNFIPSIARLMSI